MLFLSFFILSFKYYTYYIEKFRFFFLKLTHLLTIVYCSFTAHEQIDLLWSAGMRLLFLVFVAQLQVWFGASSWPAEGAELCVVPTTFPIRPFTTCADTGSSSSNCDAAEAYIQGQIGETESLQLLMRDSRDADDPLGGLTNVSLSVTFSSNDAAPATVSVYRVGYVLAKHSPRYPGSGGGWRPDPLFPLKELALFDVPAGTAQGIWISFVISRGAAPGLYNGTITVSCANGKCGKSHLDVPFSLDVWNIELPSLQDSNIGSAWSGSWNQGTFEPYYSAKYDWNTSKYEWYDLMISHRMPPDSLYLSAPRPIDDYVYLAEKGVKWFNLLDVQNLREEFQNVHQNAAPFGLKGSCQNYTDDYVRRVVAILDPVVKQLEEKGILDRAYIYGFDENPPSCEPQIRKLYGATKKAFPKLRTAAVLNWDPMPVDLPVDIWVLQYEEFNASNTKKWVEAGKEQWQYHCIEPHDLGSLNTFIERPGIQNRMLFWLAALLNIEHGAPTGWLYYAVNLWRPCDSEKCGGPVKRKALHVNNSSPFTDFPPANYIWEPKFYDIFANGDGNYLYPCESGPCPSIRLSNIRDGLEDWELFSRLSPEVGTPLITKMVRGPRDWENIGHRGLELIRKEAANEIKIG